MSRGPIARIEDAIAVTETFPSGCQIYVSLAYFSVIRID